MGVYFNLKEVGFSFFFVHNVRYGNSVAFRIWVAYECLQYLENHEPQHLIFVLNASKLMELVSYIITK